MHSQRILQKDTESKTTLEERKLCRPDIMGKQDFIVCGVAVAEGGLVFGALSWLNNNGRDKELAVLRER